MNPIKKLFLLLLSLTLLAVLSYSDSSYNKKQQVTRTDYARAFRLSSRKLNSLISGEIKNRGWLPNGQLWYNKTTKDGHIFILADPVKRATTAAFNHKKLAKALIKAGVEIISPSNLPFAHIKFSEKNEYIIFKIKSSTYKYYLKSSKCLKITPNGNTERMASARISPDGKYEAFIKDYNLWIKENKSGKKRQLTTDGSKDYGYATNNAGWIKSKYPILLWSADSKKIATFQQDARGIGEMYLVPTQLGHPKLEAWKYPLPGDEHIFRIERVIINLKPLKVIRLKIKPDVQRSSITDHITDRTGKLLDCQWNQDGSKLAFLSTSRDYKTVTLRIADTKTGEVKDILTETAKTYFESGYSEPNWRVLFESNEVIWFSERQNWGHFYLYDLKTATLKNQITRGRLNAKRIIKIDRLKGLIYFMGSCREQGNPYFDYLYRVGFDGRNLRCLTPEPAHHSITVSPGNKYLIDTFSTVNKPPLTILRTLEGKKLITLAQADISKLLATGWKPPTVIIAKGRDKKTNLYGLLYKPSNFDPKKSYPIINYIYPGPQTGSVRGFGFRVVSGNQGTAELGFIVVAVNGMGTPGRSKSFHDTSYGNIGDNTLPDQITVMKQLAKKNPWIDISRVGIHGHSGGGNASTTAILRYPNFFKVAVSQSGNHDNRIYEAPWGEKWQGLYSEDRNKKKTNYDNQANQLLAKNLKGKLLIAHGMMDNNVMPYSSLLVVQELIKHNKDFDLLIFPNSRHGYKYRDYMTRRRWDYFVKNLLGTEPPKEYDFSKKK
jgi:dipeptidyl aminopeptidase/acylaminoacyl peptidase